MRALDAIEIIIGRLSGRTAALASSRFLVGGFAPTAVTPQRQSVTVDAGAIPTDIAGTFARVGPNHHPRNAPVSGYHWFDGDGYVHAVSLRDGRGAYSGQWVVTTQLVAEVRAGFPRYGRMGGMYGLVGMLVMGISAARSRLGLGLRPAEAWIGGRKAITAAAAGAFDDDDPGADAAAGRGTANTALVVHAKQVLALNEGGLPYALRVACEGVIETLGSTTFGRDAADAAASDGSSRRGGGARAFTAHPREDAATGELIGVNYNVANAPYAEVVTLDAAGHFVSAVPITSLDHPVMIHDTAITERFVVVLDGPLLFDPNRMVRDGQLPFSYRNDLPLRIGLFPRGAATDAGMEWFVAPNGFIFHTVCTYESADGQTVTLFACALDYVDLSLGATTKAPGVLTRYDLHLPSGKVAVRRLYGADDASGGGGGTGGVDFPRIAANAFKGSTARPRYVYLSRLPDPDALQMDAIVKYDLEAEKVVGVASMPRGAYCGEAVFVQRGSGLSGGAATDAATVTPAAASDLGGDPGTTATATSPTSITAAASTAEDDGYLMTYTWSAEPLEGGKGSASRMAIFDAATMDSSPVAWLGLGGAHVPYGFHGMWLPADGPQGCVEGVEVPVEAGADAYINRR